MPIADRHIRPQTLYIIVSAVSSSCYRFFRRSLSSASIMVIRLRSRFCNTHRRCTSPVSSVICSGFQLAAQLAIVQAGFQWVFVDLQLDISALEDFTDGDQVPVRITAVHTLLNNKSTRPKLLPPTESAYEQHRKLAALETVLQSTRVLTLASRRVKPGHNI